MAEHLAYTEAVAGSNPVQSTLEAGARGIG